MPGLTVICPNAKRCFITVTPSTLLRKVLEEACLKEGYDVDASSLWHKDQIIDLSLPIRLSGLSNNACIEIRPTITSPISDKIEIALQISDGTRKMRHFKANCTLLQVLEAFSIDFDKNLLECCAGKVPCCAMIGKLFRGLKELSHFTLKSVGIVKGRTLIRYSELELSVDELKTIEEKIMNEEMQNKKWAKHYDSKKAENERNSRINYLREEEFEREIEARREIDIQSDTVKTLVSFECPTGSTGIVAPNESVAENSKSKNVEVDATSVSVPYTPPQSTEYVFKDNHKVTTKTANKVVCERKRVWFVPGDKKSKQIEQTDDDFYKLNANDLLKMQNDLKEQKEFYERRPLISQKFIEEKNRELKRNAYKHSVIRFQLNESAIVQACFVSEEPVSCLFDFICDACNIKRMDFILNFYSTEILQYENRNLVDRGIAPKSIIRVRLINSRLPVDHLVEKIQKVDCDEADELSKDWLSVNKPFQLYKVSMASLSSTPMIEDETSIKLKTSKGSLGPLPKWFKK